MSQRTTTVEDGGRLNNFAYEVPVYVDTEERVGFTPFAETWNGRFAMIGFVLLLAIEVATGKGLIGVLQSLN